MENSKVKFIGRWILLGLVALLMGRSFLVSWQFLGLVMGLGVGQSIIWIDRILFVWYEENEQLAGVRLLFEKGEYSQFFGWLAANHKLFEGLLSDSILFLIILWFLSLFIITTTINVFGLGVIMGLLLERVWSFSSEYPNWLKLAKRISPKGKLTVEEVKILLGLIWGWFIILVGALSL